MLAYNHVVSPPCGEPTVAPEAQHAAGCGDKAPHRMGWLLFPRKQAVASLWSVACLRVCAPFAFTSATCTHSRAEQCLPAVVTF